MCIRSDLLEGSDPANACLPNLTLSTRMIPLLGRTTDISNSIIQQVQDLHGIIRRVHEGTRDYRQLGAQPLSTAENFTQECRSMARESPK